MIEILNKFIKSFNIPSLLFVILIIFKLVLFVDISGITITIFSLTTTIGLIIIITSVANYIIFKNNIKIYRVFFTLNLIITFLLISDSLYFNYYRTPTSIHTLIQYKNLSGLGTSILSLLEWKYLFFIIDSVLLFPLFLQGSSKIIKKSFPPSNAFIISMFLLGLLFTSISPLVISKYEDNPFRRFDSMRTLNQYGLLGYHVLDIVYFFNDLNMNLSETDRQRIEDWYAKNKRTTNELNESNNHSEYKGIGRNKNLIVIQVESLQNFVIGKKINAQEITPNINKLLQNSIYFSNLYPQTIDGNSSDAEFLVNTSLYPLERGAVFFRYPYNTYPTLAKSLKNNGYHKAIAVHADEATFWNRDKMYPTLGFDLFYDITDFNLDEVIGLGLGDKSMFNQSIQFLIEEEQPFYSFYGTLTNHIPFVIPEEYKKISLPDTIEGTLLGNYIESVHYTDDAIGDFIKELAKENLLDNSIIVIYGDHVGIRNRSIIEQYWANGQVSDSEWLREYIPIPFIIYNPFITNSINPVVGGQIDVLPTLEYIMGINNSENQAMGQNLLNTNENFVIIPKGDYSNQTYYITNDTINSYLTTDQEEALFISDLIIKGNFFNDRN